MPLDANIIMGGRMPQVDNPLDVATKTMNLRQFALQNQVLEKQTADQNAMTDVLRNNTAVQPDGSVGINRGAALSDLYKVNPQKAMEFQKQLQSQDLDTLKNHTEAAKSLAFSATPENWMSIKNKAVQLGLPNAEKLPDQYSPEFTQRWQMTTMSGEEQIKKMENDRNYNLKSQELDLKKSEIAGKKQKDATESTSNLRNERSKLPTTKATQEVAVAYNKIQSAMKNPSPAGDMAMIFNYMKMLDPGSTVREGEYATAQNATGVPGQVLNAYNSALKGEKLNPVQRQDFSTQAGKLYQSQMDVQNKVDSQFKDLAKKAGLDPKDVILKFEANSNLDHLDDSEVDRLYKAAGGK